MKIARKRLRQPAALFTTVNRRAEVDEVRASLKPMFRARRV
jgi:hypothetical protein